MDARYTAYLLTEEWKNRRMGCLVRSNYRCEACGSGTQLDTHHLTYARIYSEPLSDLISLCRNCHSEIERLIKNQIIKRDGIPSELRKQTIRLLSHKSEPASYQHFKKPKFSNKKNYPKSNYEKKNYDFINFNDIVSKEARKSPNRKSFHKFLTQLLPYNKSGKSKRSRAIFISRSMKMFDKLNSNPNNHFEACRKIERERIEIQKQLEQKLMQRSIELNKPR